MLRKRHSWPWISAGNVRTDPFPKRASEQADPLVSIVLPTYNGVKYLGESIESCLNQTHRNLELLVVDDGSTADVRGVVSRFSDTRLRYLRHDRNQGVAAGLNTGFRHSRGDYLTWTSDDNRYAGDAIETLLRFLRAYPEVSFVYADLLLVDDQGNPHGPGILRMKPARELAAANCVGACFLYERSVYEAIGAYDSEAFLVEDYDYWIRVSARFRMQRLARPLYFYRYHPDSLTGRISEAEVNEKIAWVRRKNGVA
jgi:glycosyltransferase involved in cell wall biosynthesis